MSTSGALVLVGGLVPLYFGPGYQQSSSTTPAALPAVGAILAGALLLVIGLALGTRELLPRDPGRRPRAGRDPRVGPTVLGAGAVVFSVVLLLSVGVLPGWYYPSTGSSRQEIVGCGGVPTHGVGAQPYPDGFPPYSLVHLRWASARHSEIWVEVLQDPPNSRYASWTIEESGTSGGVTFEGSGGSTWVYAANLTSCPKVEYLELNWSYAPQL
ncbi:MAG: hypothetical protein ACLQD8_02475 [Thermoplasmata archaeon]